MTLIHHDVDYDFTIERRDDGCHVFIRSNYPQVAVARPLPRIQLPSDAKIHLTRCFANSPKLRDVHAFTGLPNDKIVDTSSMFENCPCLRAEALGSPFFHTGFPNCTNMHKMFYGCKRLNDLHFSRNWDVSKVTDMSYMFFGCKWLSWRNIDAIENWNTSSVINMTGMFGNTTTGRLPMMYILSKLHVNEFNVGQVLCWSGTLMPINLSQYYNMIPLRGIIDMLPPRVLRRILRPLHGARILRHLRFNNNRGSRLIYHPNPFSNNEERRRAMESENAMDIDISRWDDQSASGSDDE